jgi:hypothetical protein
MIRDAGGHGGPPQRASSRPTASVSRTGVVAPDDIGIATGVVAPDGVGIATTHGRPAVTNIS